MIVYYFCCCYYYYYLTGKQYVFIEYLYKILIIYNNYIFIVLCVYLIDHLNKKRNEHILFIYNN